MSFDGTYNITIQTPMGSQTGVLTLKQNGDELTGTMASQGDQTAIKNGHVHGDHAHWEVDISKPMPMTLGFTAGKADTGLSGSVKLGMFGQSTFSATAA